MTRHVVELRPRHFPLSIPTIGCAIGFGADISTTRVAVVSMRANRAAMKRAVPGRGWDGRGRTGPLAADGASRPFRKGGLPKEVGSRVVSSDSRSCADGFG